MQSLLLACLLLVPLASVAQARCYNVGTPAFRCDSVVSQALRQRIEPRSAYQPPLRSRFELNTYTAATGATRQTWRYKDSTGRRFKGSVLSLPGGAVVHRGKMR